MTISAISRSAIPFAPGQPVDGRFIITPERAQEWLDRYNKENRAFRKHGIIELCGVLERHEWCYNASPIVFSSTRLLNGQHRLMAVVRSGVAIDTDVKTGVPDEAFSTIDRHSPRTNADFLSAAGEVNTNTLASSLAWIWQWENDMFFKAIMPSPAQLRDVLDRHPNVRQSITATRAKGIKKLGGTSIPSFVHYVAGISAEERRNEFFAGLASGTNLESGSPILLLRDRLKDNMISKAKLPRIQILALYIKAWNYFKAGRPLRALRWRQDGPGPESFPVFE